MRVSKLAKSLGVTADTIRFYTRKGLLQPAKVPENGYREYSLTDQSRLRFILSARQLGFSLADIAKILEAADKGETPCPMVRVMIEQRLDEIEKRFQDMALLRNRMRRAADEWRTKPDGAPDGHTICHLIENFHE
jgi:DNA-binding transcriptional MerR regulator